VRRPLFSFGGCVYRMQVDTQHAIALAQLAMVSLMRDDGPLLAHTDYMHTSNLPQGRALWLRRQIEEKIDGNRLKWAVSVDGDTSFNAGDLISELHRVDSGFAIGLAPVRIGGTRDLCNLNLTHADELLSATMDDLGRATNVAPHPGRRAFMEELDEVFKGNRRIASGGFGVAVFNLEWFRHNWRDPAPERVSIDTGEDVEMCRSVRMRGGMIAALAVRTEHRAWGEQWAR
jgi:hypothetical protein